MVNFKRINLYITLALMLGILTGLLFHEVGMQSDMSYLSSIKYFSIVYRIIALAIIVIILPTVAFSVPYAGMMTTRAIKDKKYGKDAVSYFMYTTIVGILIAIMIGSRINPKQIMDLGLIIEYTKFTEDMGFLYNLSLVCTNFIGTVLIKANILVLIIACYLFGILVELNAERFEKAALFISKANGRFEVGVNYLMELIPFGVFTYALILFTVYGNQAFYTVIMYGVVILGALMMHVAVAYFGLLVFKMRLNPFLFLSKFYYMYNVVSKKASSENACPITINQAKNKFGIADEVADYLIPLGMRINMDGTAIMQCITTIYIMKSYRLDIDLVTYLIIGCYILFVSQGTFSVPMHGLFTVSILIFYLGVPIEGIFILIGVDRALDVVRTMVNIGGDIICAMVISDKYTDLNRDVFNG